MISEKASASCGATRCHITCVSEKPCNSNSGGPLPPVRAKMRPAEVLIHSEPKPGKRSARSGMLCLLTRQRLLLQTLFALPPARHGFMPSAKPNQQAGKRKRHVDQFRNSGRSQGNPREGARMGA